MLTEAQKKACQMLFENCEVQDVAKAVGVHRCTVWRWAQTREFGKEWTRLNRNYKRRLERSLARYVEQAFQQRRQTFEQKMQNAGISDPQRVENLWANEVLDGGRIPENRKTLKGYDE